MLLPSSVVEFSELGRGLSGGVGANSTTALQLARGFSRAAPLYDRQASVQRAIALETMALIREVTSVQTFATPPRSILEIGCGTGFLTTELVESYPTVELDICDLAQGMVDSARVHLKGTPNVRCYVGDVRKLNLDRQYDLVVSSSAVHWIEPASELFELVRELLRPGGACVFSAMTEGTLSELRALRREIAPKKPLRSELPSTVSLSDAVSAAGLVISSCLEKTFQAQVSNSRALLRSVHDLGFSTGRRFGPQLPLSRTELEELYRRYDAKHSLAAGGVGATYASCFIACSKV